MAHIQLGGEDKKYNIVVLSHSSFLHILLPRSRRFLIFKAVSCNSSPGFLKVFQRFLWTMAASSLIFNTWLFSFFACSFILLSRSPVCPVSHSSIIQKGEIQRIKQSMYICTYSNKLCSYYQFSWRKLWRNEWWLWIFAQYHITPCLQLSLCSWRHL